MEMPGGVTDMGVCVCQRDILGANPNPKNMFGGLELVAAQAGKKLQRRKSVVVGLIDGKT